MNQHVFEITDIFRGAFFLCNGGDLAGIRINGDHAGRGRQEKLVATFLIRGEGLIRLDREYRSGKALVNPLQLRESLNHLRDILFKTLREDTASSRPGRGYAGAEERKRYDDRKRKDRVHQKRH